MHRGGGQPSRSAPLGRSLYGFASRGGGGRRLSRTTIVFGFLFVIILIQTYYITSKLAGNGNGEDLKGAELPIKDMNQDMGNEDGRKEKEGKEAHPLTEQLADVWSQAAPIQGGGASKEESQSMEKKGGIRGQQLQAAVDQPASSASPDNGIGQRGGSGRTEVQHHRGNADTRQPQWFENVPQWPFIPSSKPPIGRSLIEGWRNRRIDWHDLVPLVYPGASDEHVGKDARFKTLVDSEWGAISWLQGFLFPSPKCDFLDLEAEKKHLLGTRDVSCYAAPPAVYGPTAKYAACDRVRDKCVIHATIRECVLDELCGWCAASQECVSRLLTRRPELDTGRQVPTCIENLHVLTSSNPAKLSSPAARKLIHESGTLDVITIQGADAISKECHVFVSASKHSRVNIDGNSKMAYHFYTENAVMLSDALMTPNLRTHVYVADGSTEEFLPTLHAFTDSCWLNGARLVGMMDERRPTICYAVQPLAVNTSDIGISRWNPRRGEFADADDDVELEPESEAIARGLRVGTARIQTIIDSEKISSTDMVGNSVNPDTFAASFGGRQTYTSSIIHLFGLSHVFPTRPLVTLISRRNKRLILNEPELVAVARDLGADVVIASLETMPLYEQVLLFRRTTVLVGMHGSGLVNTIYMHRGTAVIQLMPFQVSSGAQFFQRPAQEHGVTYFEWNNKKESNTVLHWHFLGKDYANRKKEIVAQGSGCCGQGAYFAFWINQDTWVDEEEFRDILTRALQTGSI